MKVLGVSGSIRKESLNTKLLNVAGEFFSGKVDFEVYVPDKLPLFSQDLEKDLPVEVASFKKKIVGSDAILLGCPEHNLSVPAALKNALEWGNRPWGDNSWKNKPAAIIGGGGSGGTRLAQHALRQIFVDMDVRTFSSPTLYVTKVKEQFDGSGKLVNDDIRERIGKVCTALLDFASSR